MLARKVSIAAVALMVNLGASVCNGKPLFDPNRKALYTQDELWKGFNANTSTPAFDDRVYKEYLDGGKFFPDAATSRLRSRHDEGIAYALRSYVHDSQRSIIGVMGSGNATKRCTPEYETTVRASWALAHDGKYLVATGGGPGQMEAANLGAYLADYGSESIDEALKILKTNIDREPNSHKLRWLDAQECKYNQNNTQQDDPFAYTAAAKAVTDKFPRGHENLGVPTWFYGNEAPNVFATTIAKFFSNGIREDLLVTVAMGGLVIAPGSAGTRQEIFMDMTQNFYNSFCYRSPVAFLGVDYWGPIATEVDAKTQKILERESDGVFALVHKLTAANFRRLLAISDSPTEILAFLNTHHPESDPKNPPEGCDKMP